jgi:hypothetical protein
MKTHLPGGAFMALFFPGIITAPNAQAVDWVDLFITNFRSSEADELVTFLNQRPPFVKLF